MMPLLFRIISAVSAKAVSEVSVMKNEETFRYDPTPMNHAFPGQPDDCFDTKKAERWFKERRIKMQQIDLLRFGLSGGEFDSVLRAVGGVDNLIDWSIKSPEIDLMRYTDDKRAKEDKLFDHPELMKTPIVRNGRQATVGYCPEIWETWE